VTPDYLPNRPGSPNSAEGRIRALVADLRTLLDAIDDRALAQSAALASRPVKPQKPPAPPMSLARAVALAKIVLPELGNYTERERVLQHRMDMRERRNDIGRVTAGAENEMEIQKFEASERALWNAAAEALRQGNAAGHVAAHLHMTLEEIENVQAQLEGRVEPRPRVNTLASLGDS
jgi:hypothetical protein